MIPNEYKIAMQNNPEAPREPPEPVKCSLFERCTGCNYPAHGFVCWNQDGSCLRTMMTKRLGGEEE